MISTVSGKAVSAVSGLATSIPALFIKLVLMVIFSFFIAVDFDKLSDFVIRQMSEKSAALFLQIREYVIGTLFVCIRSYIIIMSLTFFELSIGLSIIKIEHAVLIAACIAVFDVLPVLGTGGIMLPWAASDRYTGQYGSGLKAVWCYRLVWTADPVIAVVPSE